MVFGRYAPRAVGRRPSSTSVRGRGLLSGPSRPPARDVSTRPTAGFGTRESRSVTKVESVVRAGEWKIYEGSKAGRTGTSRCRRGNAGGRGGVRCHSLAGGRVHHGVATRVVREVAHNDVRVSEANGPACSVFAPGLTRAFVVVNRSRANMRPPSPGSTTGGGRIGVGRVFQLVGHSGAPLRTDHCQSLPLCVAPLAGRRRKESATPSVLRLNFVEDLPSA